MDPKDALDSIKVGSTILTTATMFAPQTVTDYNLVDRTINVIPQPRVGIRNPAPTTYEWSDISHVYAGGDYVFVGDLV